MTDLSPSEILTAAAKLLRERAAAAHAARPAPWQAVKQTYHRVIDATGERVSSGASGAKGWGGWFDVDVAPWVATMHPGVGLALAEVLEQAAEALEGTDVPEDEPVLTLARQLLGGES